MRIVIAGAGEVGTHLAKMLSQSEHDIILIDSEEERLKPIDAAIDVLTFEGSATSLGILRESIKKNTDLFIAVAHSEDTNITAAILAKRLGARKVIARIDNMEYLEHGNREFFKDMGIDHLIYPELIAAKEVISLLKETGTTEFMDFAGGKLSLYVQKLEKNAPVLNLSLEEVSTTLSTIQYRAVAIKRNDRTIIPRGKEEFHEGDLAYVISTREGIAEMMKFSGKKNVEARSVMVLGGSRIGRHVALNLQHDCQVKLIDYNLEKCQTLAEMLEETLIINGDGRNRDLLAEEGLPNMDAFVAVTGNSETNILSCLLAKKMGVMKTIAEVENMEYINLAENSGIDTIINKKISTASRIFRHTMNPNVTQVKMMTGTDAEVLEFFVSENARITDGPLRLIDFPKDAIIGGGLRNGVPFIATGDTHIQYADKVVVFTLPSAFEKINRFFTSDRK
ncbi:MAG: Trk system potassium transporter TrkA [Bacteroidales bacterium]|jgi:trk system potassium uptake protein TrkA|nr:Trk system potassium transporter TrkA [Bacteroidales bacterium]MCU0410267.1 Trk system potassium transporter TrkA [Bacteroidales bacterium]